MDVEQTDIAVIGAGPSGSMIAALMVQKGYSVTVIERQTFPRFSIGESLLPQSMELLEQAGMLEAVEAQGFQFKNGAAFARGEELDNFDFREKFTPGWGTTFQVPRGHFDKTLADEAARQGAEIRYEHQVESVEHLESGWELLIQNGEFCYKLHCRFLFDASGFGRVLPRLLDLNTASSLPRRDAIFTHVEDRIDDPRFDRDKILISVHPEHKDVWFWLIPFSNGRSSIGVVGYPEYLDSMEGTLLEKLQQQVGQSGLMGDILSDARYDSVVRTIKGYSCNVKSLYGSQYALLGNAGEFLDPVFSSGVTIALKSATLAASSADRELRGENVDWQRDYAEPLQVGIETFRAFVDFWYDGPLQQVIFAPSKNPDIKRMVCSVLAGYAWDQTNPYVQIPSRLETLAKLCQTQYD